ncbi:MAG: DUF58 domain-containing protein [Synergistaceae bacterium]|jgi:uncharacterized protein (DUF58 family)|nr:DUF58 domain-containing protein [Synergistaceae bacterium]
MIRPTPKAVLAFFVSVPVAVLIVTALRERWYFSLYCPIAVTALAAADLLAALWPGRVEAAVTHPKQMFLGSLTAAKVTVTTGEYLKPVVFEAVLEATGEMDPPKIAAETSKDGAVTILLPILPRRRGKIVLKKVWLRWKSPMTFLEFTRVEPVDGAIDVMPDIGGIYDAALRFFSRDAEYGIKSQRMRGDGTEFDDLRDYEPGMDSRLIDWKSSARHRKILCKEFRQERNHHIVIGFDTGRLMTEPLGGIPKLDRAIKAGLLLGWVSLYYGDFLGGCGFDVRFRSFVKPGRGMRYFARFQQFAADLAYRTEETNFTLGIAELNARLTKRTLVVLFTEFADSIQAELLIESLRWMTRRHVVLFVSLRDAMLAALKDAEPRDFGDVARAVIAADFLRERGVVLERIARMGVHCLDVTAAGVSAALLNRYLMIKQKGLL